MAAAAAAALLDELMGRDRNLAPTDKKRETRWDDPTVCKHYLIKFCPNELFVNTRADLGPCEKIHDDFMKKEFDTTTVYHKLLYEDEFLKFCQGMLSDVEKRIRRGKQRLSLGTQEGGIPTPAQVRTNEDQITILNDKIRDLLEKVEELGCEGKVEEAQGVMKLCDQLKDERENLQRANENSHWMQTAEIAAAQEKQMEVCEVCGAFLIVGDAQQRVDDHLMGKQHVGYARIKAAVDEILEKRQKEKEDKEKLRNKEREERRKQREEQDKVREKEVEDRRRKRDDDRRKDKDRDKDRDRRHRGSRDKSRKRSRSRSRGRKRSRSRDKRSHSKGSRSRRHGSRDRKKRSKSRSRDGKKSRRSRSRSSDKDKEREKRRDKGRKEHDEKAVDSNGKAQENGDDSVADVTTSSAMDTVVDATAADANSCTGAEKSSECSGNSGNGEKVEAVTEKLSAPADAKDEQVAEEGEAAEAEEEGSDVGRGGPGVEDPVAGREGDSDD